MNPVGSEKNFLIRLLSHARWSVAPVGEPRDKFVLVVTLITSVKWPPSDCRISQQSFLRQMDWNAPSALWSPQSS